MATSAATSKHQIIARIDGASRGNPGPAAYGVIIETGDGRRLAELSHALGHATNNVAEYQALLAALDYALAHHHVRLKVISDSELLARQIEGTYKVRSSDLRPLYDQARQMIARLQAFSIEAVPRAQNREADRLANRALDDSGRGRGVKVVQPSASRGKPKALQTSATYSRGILKLDRELPLVEGEEVEVEVRQKKPIANGSAFAHRPERQSKGRQ